MSSFEEEGPGTLITVDDEVDMEKPVISGIAFTRDEAKLTIRGAPDIPGVAYKILGPIGEANIEVDMIVQNVGIDGSTDFTFTVHRNDFQRAKEILEASGREMGAREVVGNDKIAKVSLVGVGMRSHAGVASKMFEVLGQEGVNIEAISTSEIKVSLVIDEKKLELAVRALHAAFELDQDPAAATGG
jgi:aspartate kinase